MENQLVRDYPESKFCKRCGFEIEIDGEDYCDDCLEILDTDLDEI